MAFLMKGVCVFSSSVTGNRSNCCCTVISYILSGIHLWVLCSLSFRKTNKQNGLFWPCGSFLHKKSGIFFHCREAFNLWQGNQVNFCFTLLTNRGVLLFSFMGVAAARQWGSFTFSHTQCLLKWRLISVYCIKAILGHVEHHVTMFRTSCVCSVVVFLSLSLFFFCIVGLVYI